MSADSVSLWTRQEQRVVDLLQRGEVYRVQRAYVEAKYQESSWSFQTAYGFFIREMTARLSPDPGDESPVWLHGAPESTGVFSDAPLLALAVPREACVFFSRQAWNHVLNLEYLAASDQDAAAFQRKLDQQGISHPSTVFRVPYYPQLKQEILSSWRRLFAGVPDDPALLQAAVWHLDPRWVKQVL